MSDRPEELLEHAAKAAGARLYQDKAWPGLCLSGEPGYGPFTVNHEGSNARDWNPLTDDGDALRLAVQLDFDIYSPDGSDRVGVLDANCAETWQPVGGDVLSATRLAIVRAAAELGKRMTPTLLTAQEAK